MWKVSSLAALTVLAGATTAHSSDYANRSSHSGFSLPGVSSPSGFDEVRASDGTTCRSSLGNRGAYLDVGGIASENGGRIRDGAVYGRLIVPLGEKPARIDCRNLYQMEIERLRLEVKAMKASLERGDDPYGGGFAPSGPISAGGDDPFGYEDEEYPAEASASGLADEEDAPRKRVTSVPPPPPHILEKMERRKADRERSDDADMAEAFEDEGSPVGPMRDASLGLPFYGPAPTPREFHRSPATGERFEGSDFAPPVVARIAVASLDVPTPLMRSRPAAGSPIERKPVAPALPRTADEALRSYAVASLGPTVMPSSALSYAPIEPEPFDRAALTEPANAEPPRRSHTLAERSEPAAVFLEWAGIGTSREKAEPVATASVPAPVRSVLPVSKPEVLDETTTGAVPVEDTDEMTPEDFDILMMTRAGSRVPFTVPMQPGTEFSWIEEAFDYSYGAVR